MFSLEEVIEEELNNSNRSFDVIVKSVLARIPPAEKDGVLLALLPDQVNQVSRKLLRRDASSRPPRMVVLPESGARKKGVSIWAGFSRIVAIDGKGQRKPLRAMDSEDHRIKAALHARMVRGNTNWGDFHSELSTLLAPGQLTEDLGEETVRALMIKHGLAH